jgi:hypothetical protein
VFCRKTLASPVCHRKSKVSEVTGRGPQKMGKEKAFRGTKAEEASQRQGTSCYPKVVTSSLTPVSVLLEAL